MLNHHPTTTSPRRVRTASLAAVGILAIAGLGACSDDDDSPGGTDVDPVTSDVTETSQVTVDSEVTIGTTLTSEVEVTDTVTEMSEVVSTEPGVTSEG